MARLRRVFAAAVLSVLVTVLCAVGGPLLVVLYVVEGVVRAVREVAKAWWAFVRLPWAVYRG